MPPLSIQQVKRYALFYVKYFNVKTKNKIRGGCAKSYNLWSNIIACKSVFNVWFRKVGKMEHRSRSNSYIDCLMSKMSNTVLRESNRRIKSYDGLILPDSALNWSFYDVRWNKSLWTNNETMVRFKKSNDNVRMLQKFAHLWKQIIESKLVISFNIALGIAKFRYNVYSDASETVSLGA